MRGQNNDAQRGFTLIELLVALGVFSIAVGMAVPSYQSYMANQRARVVAQDLYMSLVQARSEAIKRNAQVKVVPAESADWGAGWAIVIGDAQTYDACAAGAVVDCVRVRAADDGVAVDAGGLAEVRFSATGRVSGGGSPTFSICDGASLATERQIRIDLSGRPALMRGAACT